MVGGLNKERGRSSKWRDFHNFFNGKYYNLYANALAKGCNFMAFLGSDQ